MNDFNGFNNKGDYHPFPHVKDTIYWAYQALLIIYDESDITVNGEIPLIPYGSSFVKEELHVFIAVITWQIAPFVSKKAAVREALAFNRHGDFYSNFKSSTCLYHSNLQLLMSIKTENGMPSYPKVPSASPARSMPANSVCRTIGIIAVSKHFEND